MLYKIESHTLLDGVCRSLYHSVLRATGDKLHHNSTFSVGENSRNPLTFFTTREQGSTGIQVSASVDLRTIMYREDTRSSAACIRQFHQRGAGKKKRQLSEKMEEDGFESLQRQLAVYDFDGQIRERDFACSPMNTDELWVMPTGVRHKFKAGTGGAIHRRNEPSRSWVLGAHSRAITRTSTQNIRTYTVQHRAA